MGQLNWLFQLLLFYLMQYYQMVTCSSSLSSFSSSTVHNLCRHDQRSALLQFKQMFITDNTTSFASQDCAYYRGYPSYPKTVSWNESATDCCLWDGVTCDALTGHVIGLDLSCSQLRGTIHPNSSLFQLSYLRRLNLAFNDFNASTIPSAFGQFATLTHLNLSSSHFSGLIPSEISHQSKLISLDLSSSYYYYEALQLEPQNFRMLLKNLTQVQELCLYHVNISSVVPNSTFINMSSLTSVDLGETGLQGNLPHNIFHLLNLQQLSLGGNFDLTVNLPKVNQSSISSLRKLDLYYTSSSGELLDSIGFFKSLNYLDLSGMQLSEQLPDSVADLKSLNYLDLSSNNFVGSIPTSIGNLTQITYLSLHTNSFNGQVPSTLSNLRQLNRLSLSGNHLEGKIPDCFAKLARLETLYLSDNNFNGSIPHSVANLTQLVFLDISNNELQGPVPHSISNLVNLTLLDLSSNNLNGVLEIDIFTNLKNLEYLSLSHNRLSVRTSSNTNTTFPKLRNMFMSSCKIGEFPGFLKHSVKLEELDLSKNEIRGQIPEWFGVIGKDSLSFLNLSNNLLTHIELLGWKYLQILDLRFNSLEGLLPVPPVFTFVFSISHNKLSGEIPSSICNSSTLEILDLSHNNLSGAIPRCFGNFSNQLSVLDLRSNNFHGNISFTFAKGNYLRNLNLNGNQFEGPVPRSLTNCTNLEVLDLGSNKINDTFPKWLGILPQLKVLVLRSNRFYGPINTSKTNLSFPMLRIVDLSYNKFTGHLPGRYFQNLIAMKNSTMPIEKYMGNDNGYYQDSVALIVKGFEIELVRIFTILVAIDLSSNNFSGGIPDVIGKLDSLVVLNLSHNRLDDHIPPSLGELKNLESLDLSSNQLIGKIPNQLTSLTFLGALNVSWNHLVGPIPQGKQFDTFENNSYAGNSGLCGLPLSKKCEDNQPIVQPSVIIHPEDDLEFASGFTWKAVVIGYGCGMALGMIMGCLMFIVGRPKWFAEIEWEKKSSSVDLAEVT